MRRGMRWNLQITLHFTFLSPFPDSPDPRLNPHLPIHAHLICKPYATRTFFAPDLREPRILRSRVSV